MEEEEKAAHSAKLQELIRRGTPEDLQEANRLMKVMAGYDTKNKTDYRAKAAEEVGKIQQKARLLEERLQNFKHGETIEEGDVFEVCVASFRTEFWAKIFSRRSLPTHCKVLNQRSRRCVKKNLMIRKRSPNYLRLMTAYTGRYSVTS